MAAAKPCDLDVKLVLILLFHRPESDMCDACCLYKQEWAYVRYIYALLKTLASLFGQFDSVSLHKQTAWMKKYGTGSSHLHNTYVTSLPLLILCVKIRDHNTIQAWTIV